MNNTAPIITDDLLAYQTLRLQSLINETVKCCEDRKLYEIQRFGIPYAEIRCLMLFDGERYLTVKSISQRLEVAKSRVTKIVDNLVKKRLLTRINDPRDSRIKLISLTNKGREILDNVDDFHREIHKKILLELEPDERKNIITFLERLRAAMEVVKKDLVI
jgi:DNA-binding MarR family transcriptional regulator